jgi:putative ABC transport system permease protein
MRLALHLALRDLRGGLRGFGVFIACIAIGVAAIVGVSSLARGLSDGLSREGRTLMGGDLSFAFLQREANAAERAYFDRLGSTVSLAFLRAMARAPAGDATMVEMKAVDGRYPAFGTLQTTPQLPPAELFVLKDGQYGVAVDPALTGRLGLKVGDSLAIGTANLTIRAEIVQEPDRIAGGVGFGPRVLIGQDGLRATGLLQPGSLGRWAYRVALAPPAADTARLERIEAEARAAFPEAGWDIRTRDNAAPQLQKNLERFTQFLTLVGLTALAVGGVGVANAARAFIDRKRLTVAALKSVGASGGLMFTTLLIEVLAIGAIGTLIGLVIGAALPFGVEALFGTAIPAPFVPALYPREILIGLAYGLLTVAAFSIWPLGRAHDIPVSALFRDLVSEDRRWPRPAYLVALGIAVLALIGVAVLFAWNRRIALIYIVAAGGAFIALRFVAAAIMALARRLPRPRSTVWRLALVNIHKPGALTPSVILSLGLGLTLLVALGLIDHNLRNQLTRSLPDKAPSFFFVDIPAAETDAFEALIHKTAPGGTLTRVPMMRGRVTALNGTRVEQIKADEKVAWVLEGDRGLTFADAPPAGSVITEGQWWAKDHAGPPQVSMESEVASGLGLRLGDSITVNVLGRSITATIANLRKVEWQSLGINFVLVFSPNTFAGAPYSNLATLAFPNKASDAAEIAVLKAAAAAFPAVSSIRVKEALETIDGVVSKLALAVRGASGIAILASLIVLGGALAAGRRVRAQEAVILKTLGATRPRLIYAMIVEYALLGAAAAVFGLMAGTVAGYGIVTGVMKLSFTFPVLTMTSLVFAANVFVIILGLAGTWRILGQKPAGYLRNA